MSEDFQWEISVVFWTFAKRFKRIGGCPWDAEELSYLAQRMVLFLRRCAVGEICCLGKCGEILDKGTEIRVVITWLSSETVFRGY
jgi:hypothetical protein